MNSFYRFLEMLFRKTGLFPGWVGANEWPLGLGILPFFKKTTGTCRTAKWPSSPNRPWVATKDFAGGKDLFGG